jgi:hypothetical protein
VICANEDFFPHIPDLKNADKTRLQAHRFRSALDFHSGFHRIGLTKVPAQTCE